MESARGGVEMRSQGLAWGGAALSAACLAAGLLGCGQAPERKPLTAAGHVEATDVHVAAKVGGRLETFTLQEGDAVKSGQMLAQLDTTDTRLALEQARAERSQAAAEPDLPPARSPPED